MLSFGYGMMALNFPWLNEKLGSFLGNLFDDSPIQMKIFYTNMNLGSTYSLALGIIIILSIMGYIIISCCS